MFLKLSSSYVHIPIIVVTDCVIIFLKSINLLESVIDTQLVYYIIRSVFMDAPLNFMFQKVNYTDIQIFLDLFLQVFVIIFQYQPNKLKPYTIARVHSFSPVCRSL
jgi:hypothetical protein